MSDHPATRLRATRGTSSPDTPGGFSTADNGADKMAVVASARYGRAGKGTADRRPRGARSAVRACVRPSFECCETTPIAGWPEIFCSHQDVQVCRIGHARWTFEAEEFGLGSGPFESDLHGGCGDVETARGLLELERLSRRDAGRPCEVWFEYGLESGLLGWSEWPGKRGASRRSGGARRMGVSVVILVALKEHLVTGVGSGAKYTERNQRPTELQRGSWTMRAESPGGDG